MSVSIRPVAGNTVQDWCRSAEKSTVTGKGGVREATNQTRPAPAGYSRHACCGHSGYRHRQRSHPVAQVRRYAAGRRGRGAGPDFRRCTNGGALVADGNGPVGTGGQRRHHSGIRPLGPGAGPAPTRSTGRSSRVTSTRLRPCRPVCPGPVATAWWSSSIPRTTPSRASTSLPAHRWSRRMSGGCGTSISPPPRSSPAFLAMRLRRIAASFPAILRPSARPSRCGCARRCRRLGQGVRRS